MKKRSSKRAPEMQLPLFELRGQHVLVVGLGESGLAMIRYAVEQRARVSVVDSRTQPPALVALKARFSDVEFTCCDLDKRSLTDVDLIVWSPGVSIESGAGARLYASAKAHGVSVLGELDLFVAALHAYELERQQVHQQAVDIRREQHDAEQRELLAEQFAELEQQAALRQILADKVVDQNAPDLESEAAQPTASDVQRPDSSAARELIQDENAAPSDALALAGVIDSAEPGLSDSPETTASVSEPETVVGTEDAPTAGASADRVSDSVVSSETRSSETRSSETRSVEPAGEPAAPLSQANVAALSATTSRQSSIELPSAAVFLEPPKLNPVRVVAITGTNGKTTVTAMVKVLAQAAGAKVQAAGNIGPAMLDAWCDAVEAEQMPELWVLELSSFQLALVQHFSPDAAIVLNISQDHLDWHKDMASYAAAKHRISASRSHAISVRGDQSTELKIAGTRSSIGLNEPSQLGDLGLVQDGGFAWLAAAMPSEIRIPGKRYKTDAAPLIKKLMPADAMKLRGEHNFLNALAALALCQAVGLPRAPILHALRKYPGEAHRCQLIGVLDGVEYYNDSKATNVGASIAALSGLGKPCWLIAGGRGKGQDFSSLAAVIKQQAAGVILIGEDAPRLRLALSAIGVNAQDASSLEAALGIAQSSAQSGQAILLSPACASFDMFDNYKHRGEIFVDLVGQLALDRGSMLESLC